MSKVIDERVVSMQFDNKQFESNVSTSLRTIDRLKQSLNFTGAAKGLDNINVAAKKCNLAPMSSAIDNVKLKFSALEVMAVTALANITNSAVNAGKRIVSALTIDPIRSGLSEYETQLNSVQTILANTQSKGTTLDDVNRALDELNRYADMTIYNFTEMTRNIGTFTAAGVDLETSVSAIKGIANLAAISGSTSQQASVAMYQLSQALASGTIRLMDWNSVVNAGMGGEVFQNALMETARIHGVNIDAMMKKHGSFRETLQEEWLTAEILTETLEHFTMAAEEGTEQWEEYKRSLMAEGYTETQAEEILRMANTATDAATKVKTLTQLWDTLKEAAQSGWAQTWELIIGDFEEAKEMWTAVSDVIGGFINDMSNRRNDILGGALNSNWDKMIEKINEAGVSTVAFEEAVKKVAKEHGYPIEEMIEDYGSLENAIRKGRLPANILALALDEVANSAADLSVITKELKKGFTGDDVREMQQALYDLGYDFSKFGIDGIFGSETEAAVRAFQEAEGLEVTGILDDATLARLKECTSVMGNLREECSAFIGELDVLGGRELLLESFKNAWAGIVSVFGAVKKAWQGVFPPKTTEEKAAALYAVIEKIHEFSEKLREFLENSDTVDKITRTFRGLFAVLGMFKTVISGGIGLAFRTISAILKHFNLDILDVTAAAGDAIVKFREWVTLEKVIGVVKKFASIIKDWVEAFLEMPEVQERVEKIKTAFSKGLDGVKNFFSGGITAIKEFIGRIKEFDHISLDNIKTIFKDFKDNILGYFSKFSFKDIVANFKKAFGNIKSIISDILSKISEKLGITKEKFVEFRDKVAEFFNTIKEKIGDHKGAIIALGSLLTLILILSKIKNGISAIAGPLSDIKESFTGFIDSFSNINKAKAGKIKAESVKEIAKAITYLAGAIWIVAQIPKEDVWRAVGVMGALAGGLLAMILIVKLIDKIKVDNNTDITKFAAFMTSLGVALILVAASVKILGSMDQNAITQGGIAVAAFFGIVIGMMAASKKMNASDADKFGKMIRKISTSLLFLSLAVWILGSMDTNTLIQGGIAVGAFLIIMTGIMKKTSGISKDVDGFGKMIRKISTSLILLSLAVVIFGKMDAETLVQGGLTVMAFLGVMVGVMALSKKMSGDVAPFGRMMFGLSAGLIFMALAVKILGSMDTGTLVKGGLAVVAFMGIVAGLMKATSLLGEYSSNAGKMGLFLLSFAASVLLISGAVAALSFIEGEKLTKALAAITGIGLIMAGLLAVTKFAKDIKTGTLIGLSVAILVLAGSVIALSFIDGKKLASATIAVGSLMGLFSLMIYSLKSIENIKMGKSLLALGGLALVVAGLAIIIYGLSEFVDDTDGALKVATAISELIIALSASCALLAVASKYAPKTKKGLGMMAAVMGVVTIFAGAILGIALWQLPRIAEQLSKFMIKLTPFLTGASLINPNLLDNIKVLGEAMLAFTAAAGIYAISNIGGGAAEAFNSFISFIKQIVPEIKRLAIDVSGSDINFRNLNAIVDAIKALAEAAAKIPNTTIAAFGSKWGGGAAVSIPNMKVFASFIKNAVPVVKDVALAVSGSDVSFNANNLTSIVEAIGTLAEAADAVPTVDVGVAFGKFAGGWGVGVGASWTDLDGFANFVSTATTAVTSFMEKLTTTTTDKNGVSKKVPKYSQEILDMVGPICEAIEILAKAADAVPEDVVARFYSGSLFSKFKGFGISGAYGKVDKNTDLDGFANWIGSALTAVTTFMDTLSTTIDGKEVPKFTESDFGVVKSLCESVKLLGEASGYVSSEISGSFGGGGLFANFLKGFGIGGGGGSGSFTVVPQIDSFGTFITETLTALADFTTTIKGADGQAAITMKDAEIAMELCEAVTALGKAAGSVPSRTDFSGSFTGVGGSLAGILGLVHGEMSGSIIPQLEEFKKWISDVVEILPGFATGVAEAKLSENDITNINELCKSVGLLAEAAASAPKSLSISGGFGLFKYTEITELEDFTEWIATVIPLITNLAAGKLTDANGNTVTLEPIDTSNVSALTSVAQAAKVIAQAADMAPTREEMSALFGVFKWEEDTDYTATVEWFRNVYDMINGPDGLLKLITTDPVDMSALGQLNNVIGVVKTVSESLVNLSLALNTNTLSDTSVAICVDLIDVFYTKLKDLNIDVGVVANAAAALRNLGEVLVILSKFGSDYSSIDTETLKTTLTNLVNAVDTFNTKMVEVGDPATAISQIQSLANMLGGLTYISFAGVSSFVTALEELASTSIETVVTEFEDGTTDVTDAAEAMAKDAASAIKTQDIYNKFKNAGSYLVDGFCEGISKNSYKAAAKAKAMAEAAYKAAKKALDVNSPSKVFRKLAASIPEGFAQGIDRNTWMAEDSAINMADVAFNGTKKAIARVAEFVNSDVDIQQPVIRPVLDLSDVESGVGNIGRMFDTSPSLGVLSNVGTINTMMNERQNGTNNDVIAAIEDLGRKFSKSSGDTYQFGNIIYDNGSEIEEAVHTLVRAAKVERRR